MISSSEISIEIYLPIDVIFYLFAFGPLFHTLFSLIAICLFCIWFAIHWGLGILVLCDLMRHFIRKRKLHETFCVCLKLKVLKIEKFKKNKIVTKRIFALALVLFSYKQNKAKHSVNILNNPVAMQCYVRLAYFGYSCFWRRNRMNTVAAPCIWTIFYSMRICFPFKQLVAWNWTVGYETMFYRLSPEKKCRIWLVITTPAFA